MAGMFYSKQEAAEKLQVSEDQLKELIDQGKIREFTYEGEQMFKVDEVEALVGQGAEEVAESPTPEVEPEPEVAAPSVEDEILLAADDSSEETAIDQLTPADAELPTEPTGDTDMLAAALDAGGDKGEGDKSDTDEVSLDGSSLGEGLTEADTAITREGVNVLDESDSEFKLSDDTGGETHAFEDTSTEPTLGAVEEDINLDSFGSGSGLLDLSLQADDTSLGGILDEIYTPEGEEGAVAAEASAAEVAAAAEMLGADEAAGAPAAVMVQGYIEPEPDASSNLFGILLFVPFVVLLYTAIVALAGSRGLMPAVLEKTQGFIIYLLGAAVVAAVVITIMGYMAAAPAATKKPKAKKEKVKKEKPRKKPKVKKEKPKKKK